MQRAAEEKGKRAAGEEAKRAAEDKAKREAEEKAKREAKWKAKRAGVEAMAHVLQAQPTKELSCDGACRGTRDASEPRRKER